MLIQYSTVQYGWVITGDAEYKTLNRLWLQRLEGIVKFTFSIQYRFDGKAAGPVRMEAVYRPYFVRKP